MVALLLAELSLCGLSMDAATEALIAPGLTDKM